jgi:ATP-dependent Clp protease ATP-binding subunit ClpC
LTDGHGRVIDFRSSILIMTSNVGFSKSGTISGFEPAAAAAAQSAEKRGIVTTSENDRVFKELSRVFRPEFMNRIDRIINFRQLDRDIANQIAQREVNAVLKRTGIGRRNLSVEVDPSVLALLVKEGYSASFGARPLKRAIEQLFVQPLARIIASGQIAPDSKIVVTADDTAIEVKPAKQRAQSRGRQRRKE